MNPSSVVALTLGWLLMLSAWMFIQPQRLAKAGLDYEFLHTSLGFFIDPFLCTGLSFAGYILATFFLRNLFNRRSILLFWAVITVIYWITL